MVAAHHRDAGNDEQDQHQELRHGKGRLRAGGRELVQIGELLERLHDAHEDVEIEREDRGADVDHAPPAGELLAVDRIQRHGQHDQRDRADDVRRGEPLDGKQEARDAGQDGRDQEEGVPARDRCALQHQSDDHEAGHDADHADDDMQESERLDRHTKDHGVLHCSGCRAYRMDAEAGKPFPRHIARPPRHSPQIMERTCLLRLRAAVSLLLRCWPFQPSQTMQRHNLPSSSAATAGGWAWRRSIRRAAAASGIAPTSSSRCAAPSSSWPRPSSWRGSIAARRSSIAASSSPTRTSSPIRR